MNLWVLPSLAQEGVFTLEQAQQYAIENHLNAKNAQLDIDYSKKQVFETTTIGLPQVNGVINYQNFIDIPTQVAPAEAFGFPDEINTIIAKSAQLYNLPLPEQPENNFSELQFGTQHNASAGLTINQLIFDGSFLVGLKAAKVYVDLSRKQKIQTETEISHNVAKAYYTALITEENLTILKKNVTLLQKTHYETSEMLKNGFVEKLDVDRLTLTLSNLETQQKNLERQAILSKELLKFQMGMAPNQEITLSDSIKLLTNNLASTLEPTIDFNKRIEYQSLGIQLELARLNIQRYNANLLPSLGAFFNHSQNAYRDGFDFLGSEGKWYPSTVVGIQMNIPLFNLRNMALKQQAMIDREKINNSKMYLERAITIEVTGAQINYNNAVASLETQKGNMKLAKEIYETTGIKYKEGVGSSLEVTNAQTELYKTQTNYINSLYDLLNAKSDLDKALGVN